MKLKIEVELVDCVETFNNVFQLLNDALIGMRERHNPHEDLRSMFVRRSIDVDPKLGLIMVEAGEYADEAEKKLLNVLLRIAIVDEPMCDTSSLKERGKVKEIEETEYMMRRPIAV